MQQLASTKGKTFVNCKEASDHKITQISITISSYRLYYRACLSGCHRHINTPMLMKESTVTIVVQVHNICDQSHVIASFGPNRQATRVAEPAIPHCSKLAQSPSQHHHRRLPRPVIQGRLGFPSPPSSRAARHTAAPAAKAPAPSDDKPAAPRAGSARRRVGSWPGARPPTPAWAQTRAPPAQDAAWAPRPCHAP